MLEDRYGRTIDYMRISITDRCNLRCRYCMPDGIEKVPMSRILTYEQIELIVREAAAQGITKIKITGGEPLVRRGCPALIAKLKQIPGITQVTMTTNGVLLEEALPELIKAGLDAVNVSLDTLDARKYEQITGYDELPNVLSAIAAAVQSGMKVKINVVPQRDINEDELLNLAVLAKDNPLDVRFIEIMPIGAGAGYDTISNDDVLHLIKEKYPQMTQDESYHGNGPAVYQKISGFDGSIGFISAIHGKFCQSCNRIRLTSMGMLKPCLCYADAIDLWEHLQVGDQMQRKALIHEDIDLAISQKPRQHKFEHVEDVTEKNHMSSIGG